MEKIDFLAIVLLLVMLGLMISSAWNDTATFDEVAHIAAGFGNVLKRDYRLNPEHPPLVKILSALSAYVFVRPDFPTHVPSWQNYLQGRWQQQFEHGHKFLYESGNDADAILFWSRIPVMALTLLLGWLVFGWTKRRFNSTAALLALGFFAFSPTFLAHGRLVTTDVGAVLGFFIGILSFLKFLEAPSRRAVILAGLAFGTAQLFKFSLILLVPVYGVLVLSWVMSRPYLHPHERLRLLWRLAVKTAAIGLVGLVLIWSVYFIFVSGYPPERQLKDAETLLATNPSRLAVKTVLALIENPFTRHLGHYALGMVMAIQRSGGGNTAVFLGEISASGWRHYFPVLYITKETLALHILTAIVLWLALWKTLHPRSKANFDEGRIGLMRRIQKWVYGRFPEFSALVFITVYWAVSIRSPLNIGVRHVLPTFPFIYILVSRGVAAWLRTDAAPDPHGWMEWFKRVYAIYIKTLPRYLIVGLLFVWLAAETLLVFPHFISYYNELAGGPKNGWRVGVDSNYDWGQDLKRLARFAEENRIEKIAVDYFGGGNPRYYLGKRYEPWWSARGPASGWFAVSASTRQGAFAAPGRGFTRKSEDSYEWLKGHEPIAQVGYSIFVYKLP